MPILEESLKKVYGFYLDFIFLKLKNNRSQYIKCSECHADYIGKTERILSYRIKEHQSSKKDKKGNYASALYEHHKLTNHKIDFDGIKILDRADSDPKLKIKEILHIDKKKPNFNTQINSQTVFRYNVNIEQSKKKK